ncbi:MAG TPA: efflux RND transporter periplasmic adaptor subunit [Bacillota bacterium]|nr:efflux RND transporter periplasmic adaptor subunit [Bacillota bacterium]
MQKKKKLYLGAGIGVLLVLIIGLNLWRNGQAEVVAAQVFQVKQENIEENVLVSGKVEVIDQQEINARTNAMVREVLIDEGDRVKAGQVLISLDKDELRQNLQQQEANLAIQQANLAKAMASARPQQVAQDRAALKRAEVVYNTAKTKYQRYQALAADGVISREEMDSLYAELVSAETEYRSAEQRLSLTLAGDTRESIQALRAMVEQARVAADLAREELAQADVKAPMDGVVLSLDTEKGKYVTVGTVLALVGDTSGLRVKADVSEADGGRLAVGQPVAIKASALRDEEFAGRVSRVSAAAKTKAKSNGEETNVQVTVDITKFNQRLKPGYTVDLTITTASKKNALVVPYDAVMEKDKVEEVFLIQAGKVVKKRITTGVGNALYVTVEKGISKGDKVIVSPPDKLKEGSKIKETPYEEAQNGAAAKGD